MSAFATWLGYITDFLSSSNGLIAWMNSVLSFVTDHPILVIFVFIAFARGIVGIVRRWLPGRV